MSALTCVIERLERQVDAGLVEAKEMGEPVYAAERIGWEGEVQIAAWRKWGTAWDARLDNVAGLLPPPPSWSGEQNYLMAYQEVDRAFHQLRIVPVGVGIWATPFQYQWEARFAAAGKHLENSRAYLAKTPVHAQAATR